MNALLARMKRMKRRTLTAARLHQEAVGSKRWRAAFVTLSYGRIEDWQALHITRCTQAVRQHLRRRGIGFRYVWVAELQKRGAVHYHLIIWLPPRTKLPKFDDQGWWPHGMTRIEWARGAVGYLAKYTSKGEETNGIGWPKGVRICGCGGHDADQRAECAWWACPHYVREQWSIDDRPKRAPGGWISRATGEWLRSPWRLVWHDAGYRRMRFQWVGFNDGGELCG